MSVSSFPRNKKCLFALAAVIAAFLFAEVVIRARGAGLATQERYFRDIYDPFTSLVPGAANPYSDLAEFLNRYGLRGPEFTPKKAQGVYRIVCLGDSRTHGMSAYEDSFPFLLQQELNRNGARYEVINAGVPATNLYQQRLLFERLFKSVELDRLVVMSEPNFRPDLWKYRRRMETAWFPLIRRTHELVSRSALYRLARREIKGGLQRTMKDDSELAAAKPELAASCLADYREDLRRLLAMSRDRGFDLAFLELIDQRFSDEARRQNAIPGSETYENIYARIVMGLESATFAQENGFPYIDLSQDFVTHNADEPGLWNDPNHPGPLGNRLIARRIASVITVQKESR